MRNNTSITGIFLCRMLNWTAKVYKRFALFLATLAHASLLLNLCLCAFLTQLLVSCGNIFLDDTRSSCENGFFHDALYTKTLTVSAHGKTGTLLWIDDGGDVRRKTFSEDADVDTVAITISKGYATPVLFYDESEEHPKGFIYPVSTEFTEAGGFAAHILYRLIKDADDTSGGKNEARLYACHFNWKKFQELVERAAAKTKNPWECDQTRILESIADGTFTANTLKTRTK